MLRRTALTLTLSFALAACASTAKVASAPSAPAAPPAAAQVPAAPLSDLVNAVDIPYESFTLPNGLTTLVHTDRKAPIVGNTLYYRVGSKHEPRGKTGFAHLYEHLFFGGSENVPNFDIPLEGAGSTPTNGSTWYDRTNYVEVVPTGALDLALFMESDRMGHLLGAVTQDKLDKQRGVVQNEKRQGDNDSYGLVDYAIGGSLLPVGHPYRHSTIGSMADLDAASLDDVRKWFRDNYAPNNVVLALSGDIDAARARPLVEKWFGAIPRGPEVPRVDAAPVTLPAPVVREMTDQVPTIRLIRAWTAPGVNDRDANALDIAMRILGGLASSRLDKALVRGEELAVTVAAGNEQHEQLAFPQISMDVKPGIDRKLAEERFDAVIAKFVSEGPTEDEVRRAATQAIAGQIGALERVGNFGGKGSVLAEGQLYSGNPAKYREDLAQIAALTPADVKAALQRWLTRPALRLAVVPGERTEDGAKMGGWGDEASTPAPAPDAKRPAAKLAVGPKRELPPVAPVGALTFPALERATLSNGVPVTLARRGGVPRVAVSLSFDAGYAADSADNAGTQSLMLDLLNEGTTTRDADAIAEEQERLGASIDAGAAPDASMVSMTALTANLAPSLNLLADVVRHPAFRPADVSRAQSQRLAAIAQAQSSPMALAQRVLPTLLFGQGHPYGLPGDGLGTSAAMRATTPASLSAAHAQWLRPENARITVVGDVTMAQLLPELERTFGDWKGGMAALPAKTVNTPAPAPRARIVLIDRPNSPQSVIAAGRVLDITGRDQGHEALDLANEVLGNGFLSRLNMLLREEKGWTYGVRTSVTSPAGPRAFTFLSPVQSDRTGDSIALALAQMKAFPANHPVESGELARVTDGNIRGLPNRFETNGQVLNALLANDRLGRPDNYQSSLPDRYRAIDATAINAAAKRWLGADGLVILVVGDRKVVEPQLAKLGLPVEIDSSAAKD